MLRDFKFLRRNSGKNTTQPEEIENAPVNPRDSMGPPASTDSTRPPLNAIQETNRSFLNAIQETTRNLKGGVDQQGGVRVTKIDKIPTKPRASRDSDISKTPEKPFKSLETTLAGSLRREQMAETSIKQLEVGEERIQRTELIEIQKNIRLLEELWRFQDFYEEGEREILLSEVSNLQDQEPVHVCDEQTTLHLELKKTLYELEECQTNLNCCSEKSEKLSREIDGLRGSLNSISSADNDRNGGVEFISKLKEQNFKAQKELEMCRTLKGKLLADIKNNFDRVLRKESDAGDLTSKLGSFEKKILDLQFQEESMLARSKQMRFELVELMKEIDLSNKTVLASLIDQERVLKDKEEALKSLEDSLTMEFSAKDFESLILSSELEERTILISEFERKNKHFYEVAEGLKREIIFDNLDIALTASILHDKDVEVSNLQEEVAEAGRKQQNLLTELSVMDSMISEVHSRKNALEKDVCSLMEVSCLNETLKHELGVLMEGKTVLTTQVQELSSTNEKLLEELQKKDSALESSSSRIFVLDQQNQMLQNETCLLEAASCRLQNDMEMKDAEIKKMNCLKNVIEELQHEITELKGERCQLFSELEVKKAEIERINILAAENTFLRIQLRSCEKGNNDTFDMVLKVDNIGSKALDAFQNKSAELDAMLQNIYEELERASKFFEEFESLENSAEEILIQSASLQTELVRKDDIIKGLLFDLSLLQESASNHKDQKDEIDDLMASINSLENELDESVCKGQVLEVQLQEKISKISILVSDISQKCKDIEFLSHKNFELVASAKDTLEEKCSIEVELLEKREVCEKLEIEITNFGDIVGEMSNSIECLKRNLNGVTSEKEDLHGEILVLKKKLETTQTLVEENEAIAIEAKEVADIAKLQAVEKEEEVKLLERSVEELECTVNALENEVEFVSGEAEQQWLQREKLDMELHAFKQQMKNVKGSYADMRRHQEEKEKSLQEACQRIQLLEGEIISRDAELAHFKANISELKEKEEERLQLVQKVLGLCTTMLKAAGSTKPTSEMRISAAEEELEQLKNRLTSLERELQVQLPTRNS